MQPPTSSPSSRTSPSRPGRSPRATTQSQAALLPDDTTPSLNQSTAPSFTTSLAIAVEGVIHIDKSGESSVSVSTNMPSLSSISTHAAVNSISQSQSISTAVTPGASSSATVTNGESRRAPRKSKTDALAALNVRSRSPSFGLEDVQTNNRDHPNITSTPRQSTPIQVSPKLDMSSVKTASPRKPPPRTKQRPFGLEDCPVYYPTADEFKNPMVYIRSISEHARKYGICKIVPPEGWKMPFATDTENFRFKTRLQRLNSIEATSRAKINFLEALYQFHKQQGNPRVTVPTINHTPLDLWLLRKEVQKLGGFETVNKEKKWVDIGRQLGYTGIPGLSTQIKNSYTRVILPFEHYQSEGARNQASKKETPSLPAGIDGNRLHTPPPNGATPSELNGHVDDQKHSHSPPSTTSSPLTEPPDDIEMNGVPNGSPRAKRARNVSPGGVGRKNSHLSQTSMANNSNGQSSSRKDKNSSRDSKQEQICEICQRHNHATEMLLCDGCDCGFHTFCLTPALSTIPKGQWFCHTCLFGTGGDFGFDEGEDHSLSTFQARDLAFRKMWFQSHPPPHTSNASTSADANDPTVSVWGNVHVTEDDVEEEFWRLVEAQDDTVEIEYGADVHSTTHGSGMPTLETYPLDPYSKDPWNLNNLPILSDSLLRYIKSEISGMTVPWTYVGMVFSTFCWHNEDHYTYSANYMHWGETKTWYGIPGEDAEKFETAIRQEAPDLFELQPDLLFQLVTLMKPDRLTNAGVRVYACNQRAGEFVLTFPKAYHAGFNHGLNFNEAVNFALPDWLPFGRDCVKRYQEHKKLPVFSHDELLITISQQSNTIHTATWLNESFKEMTDRELSGRRRVRSLGVKEVLEERDYPEEQYQCNYCKAFCYLSQIYCTCAKSRTTKVVCLEHIDYLCECDMSDRTLRLRFSDEELSNTQQTIESSAAIPDIWGDKFARLLEESPRPSLRALRALVAEADRVNYPFQHLGSLRKCVEAANDWVRETNVYTTRRISRRGKGRDWDEATDGTRPTLEGVRDLLRRVEDLGFDTPEIALLQNIATQAEAAKARAKLLLGNLPSLEPLDLHIPMQQDFDREAMKDPRFARRNGVLNDIRELLSGYTLSLQLDELVELEEFCNKMDITIEIERLVATGVIDDQESLMAYLDLPVRARACNYDMTSPVFEKMQKLSKVVDRNNDAVREVLSRPIKLLEELEEVRHPLMDPQLEMKLDQVYNQAVAYQKQAEAWLNPRHDRSVKMPEAQEAMKLVQKAEKEFQIDNIAELKQLAEHAYDLEERCERVLRNRYLPEDDQPMLQVVTKWREIADKQLREIFSLPNCDALLKQIQLHQQWLTKLPWWCAEHETTHGDEILEDVVDYTKPEDDSPPHDEFFTCICFEPVRKPPPNVPSDAVQCDHCFARFHGRCAKNGGSCPFCDPNHWNGNIHRERSWHSCYLPTVLNNAPDVTRYHASEWKQLKVIVEHIDRFCTVTGHFLKQAQEPANQRPDLIPQVRHFMRKLYKIGFAVSPNPEVSFGLDLAGLHRILASRPAPVRIKKRRRPRFVFGQDLDKDWIDGTRCICRGRSDYIHGYPIVECENPTCNRRYHTGCVCFSAPMVSGGKTFFLCPLCCLRKGKAYRYADVRVKDFNGGPPDSFVDVKACVESFSDKPIYVRLNPPTTSTIFVDMIHFMPGQPDVSPSVPYQPEGPPRSTNGSHHHIERSNAPMEVQRHSAPKLPVHAHASSPHVPSPPWIATNPQQSTSSTMSSSSNGDMTKRKRKHGSIDGPESPSELIVFDSGAAVPSKPMPAPHRGTIPSSQFFIMAPTAQPPPLAPQQPEQHSPHSPHHKVQRSPMAPFSPSIYASHPRLPLPPSPIVGGHPPPMSSPVESDRPNSAASVRKVKLLVKGSRDSQ